MSISVFYLRFVFINLHSQIILYSLYFIFWISSLKISCIINISSVFFPILNCFQIISLSYILNFVFFIYFKENKNK